MGHGASRRAFLTGLIARDIFERKPPLPRAPLPERNVSVSELLELAADTPLAGREHDIEAFARTSVRIEPAESDERRGWSQLGGRPAIKDDDWPRNNGRRLRFLLQLAITELPAIPSGWRSKDELLQLFHDETDNTITARRVPRSRRAPRRNGHAIMFAAETTLPRAWAAPVQRLGLQTPERDAWQQLRTTWATTQGAELEDTARGTRVTHRLGGWPDERRGLMPALCELQANNIPDTNGDPHGTINKAGLTDQLPRWQLLAQLSTDPLLDWDWGSRNKRLYIWADNNDPTTVTAFTQ